jgi:hypothetical protein
MWTVSRPAISVRDNVLSATQEPILVVTKHVQMMIAVAMILMMEVYHVLTTVIMLIMVSPTQTASVGVPVHSTLANREVEQYVTVLKMMKLLF